MSGFVETPKSSASSYDLVAGGDGDGHCCPPVVDPYSWVGLVGGIALATYFLRVSITTNIMGRRRRSGGDKFSLLEGKINNNCKVLFHSFYFQFLVG